MLMRKVSGLTACVVCAAFLAACGTTPKTPDEKISDVSGVPAASKAEGKPIVEVSPEAKEAFKGAVAMYRDQKKTGVFNYQALIGAFTQALEEDPKLAEAHYNLGCIYEALRDDPKAAEQYKKALQINPGLGVAAANWGALLMRHDKLDQALVVMKRAMSKDSKNSPVLLNMAAIYQRKGEDEKALKSAAEVLTRDPTNVGAYRIMASVYYNRDDMDMAHLICLRGLKVKEKDPRLLNTLGLVLLKKGDVPAALANFRAALEQVPDMIPTRFNVAKIALDYKDYRVAEQEFRKILQYEPENRRAAIGMGIAMRAASKFDEARAHFETLVQQHPRDPVPYYWLAVLWAKDLNDTEKGKVHLKKFFDIGGSRISSDHPGYALAKYIKQQDDMKEKMAAMEKKMAEEAKQEEEKQRKLAEARKKKLDEAWAKAEKEGGVLPPAKLEGDKLPFVVIPPAIDPTVKNKVRLFGMEWKPVKKVEIGNIRVKHKQLNTYTLEILVLDWLGLRSKDVYGAWDLMITFKDKKEDPLIFAGGLWVGKPKPKPEEKKGKTTEDKGKPGKEPKGKKGVKEGKGGPEKGPKGKKGKKGKPKEPDEPKEPGEPAP
jgi:Tfp pilus assembly protein PilF